MRNALSVTFPVGRCIVFGLALALASGLAALVLVLWWRLYPARPMGVSVLGAVAWLAWSGLALGAWRVQPVGRLQWDPGATRLETQHSGVWRWMPSGASVSDLSRVQWVLDMQSVLLLRLHVSGQRPIWIWLQSRNDCARWVDLRRALTAHA